jgi:threonine/homoserine/homoserine lactone efflux protein
MPLDLPKNPTLEQIAEALERAHSTHFLGLLANYIVMVGLGTMLAGLVSGKPRLMAWIAGVLFVGASALNLMLIRHPAWFAVLNLAGVAAAAWLGQRIARSVIARGDARRSPSQSAS